jgi:hypothetical protein
VFVRGEEIMIRGFFVACILVVLFGCATGEQIHDLHAGMDKSEVIAFLGNPDGSQRSGIYEALLYKDRPINGSSLERADYNVILWEGLVIEYGFGYVRQRDPSVDNQFILVPLKVDAK